MNWLTFFVLLLFCFISSYNSPKMKADLIVTNAQVYTVNDSFAVAQSFAVRNGKFLAVGTNDEITSKFVSDQLWDAAGNAIFPGFNDAHCHFYGYGLDLMQYANLNGINDPEEIYKKLQEHRSRAGGAWLLGRGWDQNLWPDKHFPDNKRLNTLFPDIPVYLVRIDGHAAWCNDKALQLAGITATTKIEGGEVLLENGKPSGVLIDNAKELVFERIPKPDRTTESKALLEAQKNCFAAGLTSVTDCGLPKAIILLMDTLQKQGALKMRINAMMDPSEENFDYFLKNGPYKTDRLQVRSIKLYADGALGSRGAYLLDAYSDDPDTRGLLMNNEAYFEKICKKAFDAGFQVATHAIGDGANRFILNIYGKFLNGPNDRRWRIEHAQIVHPDDLALFKKYAVIPSVQATHATSDMRWAVDRLGAERLKTAYAYQQLLAQNGWLPNGTDFPIEDISPLKTFYAAVFRKNQEGIPEGGFQMQNALTREQAIRSMTIWAAKAGFQESETGSIEPGKSADFVILDTDLMTCTDAQVLNAKILKTIVNGQEVYKAPVSF